MSAFTHCRACGCQLRSRYDIHDGLCSSFGKELEPGTYSCIALFSRYTDTKNVDIFYTGEELRGKPERVGCVNFDRPDVQVLFDSWLESRQEPKK